MNVLREKKKKKRPSLFMQQVRKNMHSPLKEEGLIKPPTILSKRYCNDNKQLGLHEQAVSNLQDETKHKAKKL